MTLLLIVSSCSRDTSKQSQESQHPYGDVRSEQEAILPIGSAVYVVSDVAEERTSPNISADVRNRIYRGQTLTVYELSNGWVRVTADGFQARWVNQRLLSVDRPPELPVVIPDEYRDSRIAPGAIPETVGNGLSEADVLLLWRGAKHMLVKGRCSRIDYADKSTSRAGVYFVQEGNRNIYFTEADLR